MTTKMADLGGEIDSLAKAAIDTEECGAKTYDEALLVLEKHWPEKVARYAVGPKKKPTKQEKAALEARNWFHQQARMMELEGRAKSYNEGIKNLMAAHPDKAKLAWG
ncbi:MAG: hypothetical protein JRJ12_15535 [Deltaproteobacteria bacterium]|nr:hypothetical protein [Deltaproteobacteria bacterium]